VEVCADEASELGLLAALTTRNAAEAPPTNQGLWSGRSGAVVVPGLDGKAAAPPTDFVKVIQAFDSHERGILFQWSAGSPFVLSAELRQRLGDAVQVDVPGDAYVAMDYTLDWLHAAITCYLDPNAWDEPQPLGDGTIAGSQEDVDLLVAWEEKGPHVVLIEAKGFTGWS